MFIYNKDCREQKGVMVPMDTTDVSFLYVTKDAGRLLSFHVRSISLVTDTLLSQVVLVDVCRHE